MVALQWCVSFSVQFSHSVVSSSLPPHGLQHARLPCPSPTRRACSNSCPMSQWCHPTISSSAVPFSSCLQSFPASGSFPVSQLLTSCGQSIGASGSASVLLRNIQGWFPLGVTCLISLLSKGLSRVFSNTTVQKHQLFGPQLLIYVLVVTSLILGLIMCKCLYSFQDVYLKWIHDSPGGRDGDILMPILQVGKWRFREVRLFA